MRDAITGQRRIEEIYEMVDEINSNQVKEEIDKIFMTSLATRHIDYSGMMQRMQEADENRLMPEYIEDYFLRAFKRFDGKFEKGEETYKIKSVPYELLTSSAGDNDGTTKNTKINNITIFVHIFLFIFNPL